MLEMASLGSKVLQIRSVEFAGNTKCLYAYYQVLIMTMMAHSTKTSKRMSGTLITTEAEDNMEQPIISGIAFNRDEAKLNDFRCS